MEKRLKPQKSEKKTEKGIFAFTVMSFQNIFEIVLHDQRYLNIIYLFGHITAAM